MLEKFVLRERYVERETILIIKKNNKNKYKNIRTNIKEWKFFL